MDGFSQQITKETLRIVLGQVGNEQSDLRARIQDLLAQDTIDETPYIYSTGNQYRAAGAANSLAAAVVNAPANILVQADADFIVLAQSYDANTANAAATFTTKPVPNLSVLMVNTGSGYQQMNAAVAVPAAFGFGWQPFILPVPWLWPAKANILLQVSNFDAAAGYNLELCFHGVKLKRY